MTPDPAVAPTSRQANRTLEMARALVGQTHVIVATPGPPWADDSGIRVVRYQSPMGLRVLMDNSDVAVVPARLFDVSPTPVRTSARLVVDLLEPVEVTSDALRVGDFYVCESEAQRDASLRALVENHRVSRQAYAHDHEASLRHVIDVVQTDTSPQPQIDPLRLYCARATRPPDEPPWISPSLAFRVLRTWRRQGAGAVAGKSVAYLRRRFKGI